MYRAAGSATARAVVPATALQEFQRVSSLLIPVLIRRVDTSRDLFVYRGASSETARAAFPATAVQEFQRVSSLSRSYLEGSTQARTLQCTEPSVLQLRARFSPQLPCKNFSASVPYPGAN